MQILNTTLTTWTHTQHTRTYIHKHMSLSESELLVYDSEVKTKDGQLKQQLL